MSLTLAIPTFDNDRQLVDTLVSLCKNTDFQGRVLVVNNGNSVYEHIQAAVPMEVDWIDAGENLGWTGGVNLALEHTRTEHFCMCNDDVLFPPASVSFWDRMMTWFQNPDVGGVGPTSNYVSGYQNAFIHTLHQTVEIPFLIGMCAAYRTDLLKDLGGLDPSLPGGDDLDLSIRVIDSGHTLIADRRCFLFHHGAQTGRRVHGEHWDSHLHQADTYNALIRKHGLKRWYELMNGKAQARFSFRDQREHVVDRAQRSRAAGDNLASRYYSARTVPGDIDQHLDVLYRYASGCRTVTEFGTNDCTSATALLYAKPERLHCYDIERFPEVDDLVRFAGEQGTRFTFHHRSTLDGPIDETEMLFIDDLHTGEHVRKELEMHAGKVGKYLFFHDTVIFGDHGELERSEGIWPAIRDFMRGHPEWRICHHNENENGLLGLVRVR